MSAVKPASGPPLASRKGHLCCPWAGCESPATVPVDLPGAEGDVPLEFCQRHAAPASVSGQRIRQARAHARAG